MQTVELSSDQSSAVAAQIEFNLLGKLQVAANQNIGGELCLLGKPPFVGQP